MAKFVCLLVFLAVLVSSGSSLKCYHCNSEKLDVCIRSAGPKEQACGNPAPGQKAVCYYKHSYDTNRKVDMVNASCGQILATAATNTLTECQQVAGVNIKECRVCDSDLCNSSTALGSMFALVCLPIIFFVTKLVL